VKIQCLSWKARRRNRAARKAQWHDEHKTWHFYFCWRPVRSHDDELIWLETVARRYYPGTHDWEYGPITNLLTGGETNGP